MGVTRQICNVASVVVLGGGTASRLGGVSKPDYRVKGTRLIDLLFNQLDVIGFSGRVIAVVPECVELPDHVTKTLEDPPLGGPLAGIGAAVETLRDLEDDSLVALATCDAPMATLIIPELLGTLISQKKSVAADLRLAGVAPISSDGWPQFAHGVYSMGALRSIKYERNRSIHSAFKKLNVCLVPDSRGLCMDVDTQEDARAFADLLTKRKWRVF